MTAVDLAYTEAGSGGVPLLLLHDLAGKQGNWRELIPFLADQRRVIVADLRGHGESPEPAATDGYGADTLGTDCLRLLDSLDVSRFAVAGSDLGAIVAIELAFAAPERVAAIVVSDASPAPGWPSDSALLAGFERTIARRLAAAEEGGMAAVATSILDYEAEPRVSEDPGPRERIVARWTDVPLEGFIGSSRALLDRRDRTADLATLTVPQLWIAGELGPMREAAKQASTLSPLGQLELIPRCGIGCVWQRPQLWAAAVNGFLDDATT
jgi:pimeloyl-ACP methyl ester carboxylesterase